MEVYKWVLAVVVSAFVGAYSIVALNSEAEKGKVFLIGAIITFVILVAIGLYN